MSHHGISPSWAALVMLLGVTNIVSADDVSFSLEETDNMRFRCVIENTRSQVSSIEIERERTLNRRFLDFPYSARIQFRGQREKEEVKNDSKSDWVDPSIYNSNIDQPIFVENGKIKQDMDLDETRWELFSLSGNEKRVITTFSFIKALILAKTTSGEMPIQFRVRLDVNLRREGKMVVRSVVSPWADLPIAARL